MRGKGKIWVWPAYFDSNYSWSEGRRVPNNLSIRAPKVEDIEKAAQDLGLNPIMKPGASYPKYPWKKTGAVLVDRKKTKTKTLKEIANKLK